MIAEKIPALKELSLEEKWLLANELIDEVANQQQELPSSEAIRAIVEQRFREYEKDPSTALTLETFKHRFSLP